MAVKSYYNGMKANNKLKLNKLNLFKSKIKINLGVKDDRKFHKNMCDAGLCGAMSCGNM